MKQLILTPECQDLWVLSPSMLFNYDQVVIDETDCKHIISPSKETSLSASKAKMMEKLKDEGLVETIDYKQHLSCSDISQIHQSAEGKTRELLRSASQDLYQSDFFDLALHSHLEYEEYLKNSILYASMDDLSEIKHYKTRLDKIKARTMKLKSKLLDDSDVEVIAKTLSRISAKSLAALIISNRSGINSFFDTREYAPFIGKFNDNLEINYDDSPDCSTYDVVVSAFCRRDVPLITDRTHLFAALEKRSEFDALKIALRRMEEYLAYLVDDHPQLARDKIRIEIARLQTEYKQELERIIDNKGVNATWKIAEMVTSQFAGFINPMLSNAKKSSEQISERQVVDCLYSGDDFKSHLFYVAELWNRAPDGEVIAKTNYVNSDYDKHTIWGETDAELPWYENITSCQPEH